MVLLMTSVAERWAALQSELKALAPHRTVRVVAVAKYQPLSVIQAAVDCGIREFGDNYVQQGESVRAQLTRVESAARLHWHFIGHIQSRKVRDLLVYDCVQSVDRPEIVEGLAKRLLLASDRGAAQKLKVLVQVNIGMEPQKSGVVADEFPRFLETLDRHPVIQVDGLMAMPPPLEPVQERARYFDEMRTLFEKYGKDRNWTTLSLGTSDDYAVAVRCGATMIRLGTSLLGPRPVQEA
jgi:PLP dependent protein